jgi:hypothetical protein
MKVPEILATFNISQNFWRVATKEEKSFLRTEAWRRKIEDSKDKMAIETDPYLKYLDRMSLAEDKLSCAYDQSDARKNARNIREAIFRLTQALRVIGLS